MKIAWFCHSLVSDWNHGNAHFIRGIAAELLSRGHTVEIYEPRDAWSARNLVAECGEDAIARFRAAYPELSSTRYDPAALDLDRALDGADLAIVHEWNDPELVRRIGRHRARSAAYRLLFHDTHHRAVTDSAAMAANDLRYYDGVLAFGAALREIYVQRGWARRAWTWHEAADTRRFYYTDGEPREGDLVWIGNWGDGERDRELREYLIEPACALGLRTRVYGVRYPEEARRALADAGAEYCGWLANYEAPRVFARFRFTVHVPRNPYAGALAGIPTIRVFEALASGIPLVSAPWDDCEGLFRAGRDYLRAADGNEMRRHMRTLMEDEGTARQIALHGRQTILASHTCAHRVDELMEICAELGVQSEAAPAHMHA